MAYKFQRGKATLSGSISAEEGLKGTLSIDDVNIDGGTDIGADLADADLIIVDDGAGGTNRKSTLTRVKKYIYSAVSGDATVSDAGALTIAANAVEGSMLNSNVAGPGVSYSSDKLELNANPGSFSVSDGNGLMLSSSVAGTALDLVGGAINFNIDGLTALGGSGIAQTDNLVFSDDGTEKKITFSNFEDAIFGNVSGDATIAAGGALTIAANAVEGSMINSNAAGDGIAYSSNALQLDLNELTAASVAVASDSIAIIDADDSNKSRKESIADLATGMAGTGLSANAGEFFVDLSELSDVQIAAGDSIAFIDATDSNKSRKDTVDDLATLFAGDGLSASSAVMALDLNELSAAAVDVAADSIAIVDANDSNKSRKESIADLVTAMAGAGLTATSGVLKVTSNNVNLKADSEALVEGYNYFADASSNATVTLPASPSVGDVVVAKAGNLTSGAKILINKGSADHRIDGEESVTIESPFGAITMVYVVADAWRIV